MGDAFLGVPTTSLAEVCPVNELYPLLVKSDGLLGALNLRGQLIPLIDPSVIFGFSSNMVKPRFAAVLRQGGKVLAIGIDEVAGLATVAKSAIQPVEGLAGCSEGLADGIFYEAGMAVTLANVANIFRLSGATVVSAGATNRAAIKKTNGQHSITFEAGGAFFSVPAVEVYGTVPRQIIEKNALSSEICLGSVNHHNRRIPVLCTVDLFQIGEKRQNRQAELLVLRFPNDQLLGLAVDAIRNMEAVSPELFSTVPDVISARNP